VEDKKAPASLADGTNIIYFKKGNPAFRAAFIL